MSHVATIDLHIKDLDALGEACSSLGLELIRGQTSYRWWGKHVGDYPLPAGFTKDELGTCLHAIRVPEARWDLIADGGGTEKPYEIGVVSRRDGQPGFTLLWDFIAGGFGMEKYVGKDCVNLKREYARAVVGKYARQHGFRIQQQVRTDGSVAMTLSR